MSGQDSELLELLAHRFTIDGRSGQDTTYGHVVAPPVAGGAIGVPEVVVPLLTMTDGVELFCSDDEKLNEWGVPAHSAVLYDKVEIDHWTLIFRERLTDELRSWRDDGELAAQRFSELVEEVSGLWVIGATMGGDSCVVGSARATAIRVWPHETPLVPLFDPDGVSEAPIVEGLSARTSRIGTCHGSEGVLRRAPSAAINEPNPAASRSASALVGDAGTSMWENVHSLLSGGCRRRISDAVANRRSNDLVVASDRRSLA